jgi:O-antigen/teichoic acid export membrane protein
MTATVDRAREFVESYARSHFFRAVAQLAGASLAAQIINFSLTPFVTRLYSPDAYGAFGFIASTAGVASAIACLQYDKAIVLGKDEEEVANLTGLSFLICAGVSSLMLLPCVGFRDRAATLFGKPEYAFLLTAVPVFVFLRGCIWILQARATKSKEFGAQGMARVASAVGAKAMAIQWAWLVGGSPLGLMIAWVVQQLAAGLVLVRCQWRHILRHTSFVTVRNMLQLAKEHSRFPLYEGSAGLIYTLREASPILLVAFHFGHEHVGYYTLVRAMLMMPQRLLGEAITRPFYERLARCGGDVSSICSLSYRLLWRLAVVTGIPFLLLAPVFPFVFPVAFGQAWEPAGHAAQALSILIWSRLVIAPILAPVRCLGLQRMSLLVHAGACGVGIAALYFGGQHCGFVSTLFLYSLCTASVLWLQVLCVAMWTRKKTPRNDGYLSTVQSQEPKGKLK